MRSRAEEKARDFDYYEGVTVRDSSLSACTQAIVAAEVGHLELAYDYFAEAALHGSRTTSSTTSATGFTSLRSPGPPGRVVAGLGGLRDDGEQMSFAPRLPNEIERVAFRVTFHGNTLRVEVTRGEARYRSRPDGRPLVFLHWGTELSLPPGGSVVLPIPGVEPLASPAQPLHREPGFRERPAGLPD